jgi:mRNA interferase MazF
MEPFVFGDVVLLKFPFTDGKSFKKRPALIINDFDDGDIIVCRITSQIYDTKNDYFLDNWRNAGLKLPSVVRVHKIATLDRNLVETRIGKREELSKKSITQIIKNLTDL